jgi:hypothetical protein
MAHLDTNVIASYKDENYAKATKIIEELRSNEGLRRSLAGELPPEALRVGAKTQIYYLWI